MHAMSLLDKWLQRNAVIGHRATGDALVRVVGALVFHQCSVPGGHTAGAQRAPGAFQTSVPSSTVTAWPPRCTRSPSTRTRTTPPRADAW